MLENAENFYPLISVIIPAYNVEDYIEEAVNSVLNQSFKRIELIAVNDGSTDRTGEILESFRENDQRVHVIHQKNKGVSAARNIGLKQAKGTYIHFLDGDDKLSKKTYSYVYSQYKKHNCDIIGFSMEAFQENKPNEKVKQFGKKPNYDKPVKGEFHFSTLIERGTITSVIFLYVFKKEYLNKHQLFFQEGFIHEDEMFIVPALCLANSVITTEDVLLHHREHEDSFTSKKRGIESAKSSFHASKLHLNFLKKYQHQLSEKTILYIQNRSNKLIHLALKVLYRMRNEENSTLWIDDFLTEGEIRQRSLLVQFRANLPSVYQLFKKINHLFSNLFGKPFIKPY
ncbi:MAG: glycosyltransferase family 2 protein [Balneolaceae bacterium]|nr:glycosyltransferase family 2 protein [Balneolaceae bacterium]MDR9409547.1 glycosyltransferase family 2 protein [Balneolaceae bacterium]